MGGARTLSEDGYKPRPEQISYEDIQAVFVKRVARRTVVAVELPARRKLVLALPPTVEEEQAMETGRMIARMIASRLGVPAYLA